MQQKDLRTDGQKTADTPSHASLGQYRLRQLIRLASIGASMCLPMIALPASANSTAINDITASSVQQASPMNFMEALDAIPASYDDVWGRLRAGYQLQQDTGRPRVRKWIDWYTEHPKHVERIAEQARPWIRYVTRRTEARGLPAELALLPFIESAYDPDAAHPGGATGMWQFMPATGDEMGLTRNRWYDGRKDVLLATDAALDYLQSQGKRWYGGDWELALAAYNAGAGTVNRARERADGDDDYWGISLPNETMEYVPKLLALAAIIRAPDEYGITLPEIPDKAEIAAVDTGGQLDLSTAAKLAGISESQLRALNPAYKRWATSPGDSSLVIPATARDTFLSQLASLPEEARQSWNDYRVQRGDTLSVIARRSGLSLSELKAKNHISSNTIRVGQALMVPDRLGTTATQLASANGQQKVRVKRGDSLSRIAARHNVTTRQIAHWNKLSSADYLRPGQMLTLYSAN
ncbi:LysM peptidoglycan-binding domain-containing protein [Cobetia sp. L2A1]|uniref:LysM peptidoglycan-binding domain-containing protein n=1 Tax=Cobetia sp. L2A1 TaxID=2686360 RepID=UPI00131E0E2B|nr:LysM peptidoglycan-binding domain-containing protein [Cobetia sp. L2A1]